MKKITRATLKSFVRKNIDSIYINVKSKFNGMVDCVESVNGGFSLCERESLGETYDERTQQRIYESGLGLKKVHLVGGTGISGDWFKGYEDDQFTGIEVSNCCGRFILAIKK